MLNDLILFGMSSSPQGEAGAQGGIASFLPFILIIFIVYFLMIRPQSKKAKEQKNMLASMKKGDKVITIGGVYAKIVEVKDSSLILDIGKGNTIEIDRNSINTKLADENQIQEKK